MKFLAEISKPQYQAEFTKYITYGPTNKKAYDLGTIEAAYAKRLPSHPDNAAKQLPINLDWYIKIEARGVGCVPEHADGVVAAYLAAGPGGMCVPAPGHRLHRSSRMRQSASLPIAVRAAHQGLRRRARARPCRSRRAAAASS